MGPANAGRPAARQQFSPGPGIRQCGKLAAQGAQRWARAGRLLSVEAETADVVNGPGRPMRAGNGDADWAVTALFREHHLELVRLALVMVGDLSTAEDVVQDAFERLHRRWHRLRDPGSGLAYARSAVLNGCRTVHRRSAVARKHGPRLAGSSAAGPDSWWRSPKQTTTSMSAVPSARSSGLASVPIVAEIFGRYAGYESTASITRWLNESGTPTPWNVTRIRNGAAEGRDAEDHQCPDRKSTR